MSLPSLRRAKASELAKVDESFVFETMRLEARQAWFSILWRQRGLYIKLVVPIFLLLTAGSFYLPKNYNATALLAYDLRPVRAATSAVSNPSTSDELVNDRVEPSILASEAQIITSRATI